MADNFFSDYEIEENKLAAWVQRFFGPYRFM